MKMSNMIGTRSKTIPSDANAKGYANLLRAGYIKQVSNGIFSLLPPAKLIINKMENIVREEMNAIDGQEVLFPVVMPKELWEESGRYSSIGDEMIRFTDRAGKGLVLGMTHEEAAVQMARNVVTNYNQLPFMIYQIQTKFRDEARSRGGLIRVREFTMKDAYSFHTTQEDLNNYYNKVYDAYNRIFSRFGMKDFVAVNSDSGMMGGNGADEFMLLNPIGEDTIVLCDECGYKANQEVATSNRNVITLEGKPQEEVFTGEAKTIKEICELLNISANQTCKAVCFGNKNDAQEKILVFIRGDLEVNETKLRKIVGKETFPITLSENDNLVAGNIGLINLPNQDNLTVVYDDSLKDEKCLLSGANKKEYHISGVDFSRDVNAQTYDVAKVVEGEFCPKCGKPLRVSRGVEIGNIFKLGTKYTKVMNMTIHDQNGKDINPIMGCYGIGIGRALGCVAEESSDDKGLVWPMSITPFHIYLCPLKVNTEEVKLATDKLYKDLQSKYDVLLDDRNKSAGYKFNDSELMGIPVRIVISPRSLETNSVELTVRATDEKQIVNLADLDDVLSSIINK